MTAFSKLSATGRRIRGFRHGLFGQQAVKLLGAVLADHHALQHRLVDLILRRGKTIRGNRAANRTVRLAKEEIALATRG